MRAADRTVEQTAVLIMIGASALVATTSILAKLLGLTSGAELALHPLQVSAGRFCFALCALVIFLALFPKKRPSLKGAAWHLHLLRSLCGWLGVTAMFAAVAQMPVAEATAISFLSPMVTLVLANAMLGERINLRKLCAAGVALLGAALILKPGSDAFQVAGLLALAAAALMGAEAIFIKRLTNSEPALRILLINNFLGAVMSLGMATLFLTAPSATQWILLVSLGAIMVCGQALFIQSMKRADASLVMPAFYSVLIFAALFDFALFSVLPDGMALMGAGLIIASAVLLSRATSGPAAT